MMYEEYALLFKVLSDPNRLKIIELLISGETCSCTLIDKLPITQPTLSYHLKIITSSGLATSRKEGTWMKYFINKDKLSFLSKFIVNLKNTEVTECSL
ncbi:MAG: metalloregulator ArsR/SmtB family transcription factor [Candidatus Izemoplasma sp.]